MIYWQKSNKSSILYHWFLAQFFARSVLDLHNTFRKSDSRESHTSVCTPTPYCIYIYMDVWLWLLWPNCVCRASTIFAPCKL